MSISWGAWTANNRWRVGTEVVYSIISGGAQAAVTTRGYFQVRYASSESGQPGTQWGVSGVSGTASGNFEWSLGDMGTKLIVTKTWNVNLTYGSTQQVTGYVSAHVSYTYPGDGTSSQTVTLPARPVSAPAAPSGASLSYGSGDKFTLSWTRNATSSAPYDSQEVQTTSSKDTSWWGTSVSGSATSLTNSGSSDRKYQQRVRAKNSAGTSSWSTSGWVSMTPAAPGKPSVVKDSSGSVVVSWPAAASGSSTATWEVWHAANGVWDGAAAASLSVGTTSWTHVGASGSAEHTYRLRAVSTGPTLTSAYGPTSDPVQVQGPPNAPSNLAPSGGAADPSPELVLSWRHNPVDGSPQRQYQEQHRAQGSPTWVTGPVVSGGQGAVSQASLSGLSPGTALEWQVRTWGIASTGGADGTGASAWSATASVTLASKPIASISDPGSTVTTSTVTVWVGYYQAQSDAFAQWRVQLLDAAGQVIESQAGPMDPGVSYVSAAVPLSTVLTDATSYTFRAQVQSSVGLWSDWVSQASTVTFVPPPLAAVSCTFLADAGAVAVEWSDPGAVGAQPPIESVAVWRSAAGGPWVVLASGLDPDGSITDYLPSLGGTCTYKVVTTSATPSSAQTPPIVVDTTTARHVFVNAGPGFSRSIRLASNMRVGITAGRTKTLRRARGRALPVEFTGDQRTREVQVQGALFDPRRAPGVAAASSSWDEIAAFVDLPGPACVRTPDGLRIFCAMPSAGVEGIGGVVRSVSWTLTETDWREVLA